MLMNGFPSRTVHGTCIGVERALTPPPAPAQSEAPTYKTYTVKSGDNLSKIAKLDGSTLSELAELNGTDVKTLSRLQPGQKIKVRNGIE